VCSSDLVSGFLFELGLPAQVSFTIVSLAVSSFVLTTLDTVARLGRLSFQELFTGEDGAKGAGNLFIRALKNKSVASIFTLGPAFLLAILGYQSIWALFGAANQLLAALTLIACTMFFKKTGRKNIMLLIPTIIMLAVTFTSLVLSIKDRAFLLLHGNQNASMLELQIGISALLLILGILVAISCTVKLLEKNPST
jgi:carbon starvation protein